MANFGLMGWVSGGMILTLCALVGGLAFEAVVLRADKTGRVRAITQTVRLRWLRGGTLAMMAASALALFAGLPTWILIVRLLMGGAILLLLGSKRPLRDQWRLFAIGVLLLQTQSFISRSTRLAQPVVPLLADWFHLTLAAIWLGGVAMLALIIAQVWRDPSREVITAVSAVLRRFSLIAMFCVVGLAVSGIAQAALFLTGFDDLWRSTYGLTLSLKLALFTVLLGFGVFHQQWLMPVVRNAVLAAKSETALGQAASAVTRLRWGLLLESGIGILLLGVVGWLTTLPLSFNP